MKICNLLLSLNKGGAENVATILSNEWSKKKHNLSMVVLINRNEWPFAYHLNKIIKVHDLDLYSESDSFFQALKKNIFRLKKIREILKKINPDIIIAHCSREIVLTFFSTFFLNINIIGYIHSHPKLVKEKSFLWRFLAYLSFSFIKHCIIFSKSSKSFLPFLARKKSIVMSNVSNENLNEKLQVDFSIKNIIIVGSFIHVKNHLFAIRAFSNLQNQFNDWSLTIVGDGPLRMEYLNLIKDLNLEKKVFLPGNKDNIYEFYSKASIFLLPSLSEGLSLSLLEAIKFRLPVIISNCSESQNEILTNNYNSIIYNKNLIEDLTLSMKNLMSDRNLRETMSTNLEFLSNKISNKKIIEKWESILEKYNEKKIFN